MTFDQYLNGSTGGERYLLPVPETRSSDAWYSILTNKNLVTIAQGGTGASSAAAALANLGAVAKAGDTMTGNLIRKADNIDVAAGAPSSSQYCSAYQITDDNGAVISVIEAFHSSANDVATRISAKRIINGTTYWNQFDLLISSTGAKSYKVTDPAAFRTALALTGIAVRPDYQISTTDLTAGTSSLTTNKLYFVYA